MKFSFKSIHEFNDYFQDEKTCLETYEKLRWNGDIVCPHCESEKIYKVPTRSKKAALKGTHSYRCGNRKCDKHFSATTGTIFESSKITLRTWFTAIYYCTNTKKGISSVQLAEFLGVTQKTAWFIGHRVRAMLVENGPELLKSGMVEIDETYVGGKNKNRHKDKKVEFSQGRSAADKTPVVGILERGGKVKTFVVNDTEKNTLHKLANENIEKNSVVVTDSYTSYNGLSKNFTHVKVKHAEGIYTHKIGETVLHTQNIENFWSILKRGIIGIYHSVSPKHLYRYCDEFSYRYNYKESSHSDKFILSLSQAKGRRLSYKILINKIN
ncbi:MAG: IS1595 family transposase [Chitinophagaceae bacterium]|nr:IS1595 family transposase [Chitinophagaceae bacterium]